VHAGALQALLAPGQRLVSKDGDLWRWDGYSVQAGTASPFARPDSLGRCRPCVRTPDSRNRVRPFATEKNACCKPARIWEKTGTDLNSNSVKLGPSTKQLRRR